SLQMLRNSMIHFSKMLFGRQIDGRTYLELMDYSYEQIRKVLMKAIEDAYPDSFFRRYTEVFSDPIVTRFAVFLLYNYKSLDLSHDEARWCSLVLQGNVADAGPPQISKHQTVLPAPLEEGRVTPSRVEKASEVHKVEEKPQTTDTTTRPPEAPSTVAEVKDEFTEIVEALRKERDRLPDRERSLIFFALLTISYCRGKVDYSQLVQLGNEYLEKAVGLDPIYLGEKRRWLLKRLASVLKRKNVSPAIVSVFDNPEILSSGRRIKIQ
ncbi:MAG: hypothetical protein NZ733_04755, partial [Aigarchaeota archaeon]|nr:hypothetical protein [Aigarchaeota archaeon]